MTAFKVAVSPSDSESDVLDDRQVNLRHRTNLTAAALRKHCLDFLEQLTLWLEPATGLPECLCSLLQRIYKLMVGKFGTVFEENENDSFGGFGVQIGSI